MPALSPPLSQAGSPGASHASSAGVGAAQNRLWLVLMLFRFDCLGSLQTHLERDSQQVGEWKLQGSQKRVAYPVTASFDNILTENLD